MFIENCRYVNCNLNYAEDVVENVLFKFNFISKSKTLMIIKKYSTGFMM